MTIEFSKQWSFYSWSKAGHVAADAEQLLILEMIKNCDNEMIRMYALHPDAYGVYVRTGLHTSKTESHDHVQLVLGSNDPSAWTKTGADAGYTAHILYHNPVGCATKKYEAHLFTGQHHLKRVGT